MVTVPIMPMLPTEEELLLLEFESIYDAYMPFFEFEDVEVTEPKPLSYEAAHWAYRVPCAGVKYYTFE